MSKLELEAKLEKLPTFIKKSSSKIAVDNSNESKLFELIRFLKYKEIEDNCTQEDINLARKVDGFTPLFTAVKSNDEYIVNLLLYKGAQVNITSLTNHTALDLALKTTDTNILIIAHLLKYDATFITNDLHTYLSGYVIKEIFSASSESSLQKANLSFWTKEFIKLGCTEVKVLGELDFMNASSKLLIRKISISGYEIETSDLIKLKHIPSWKNIIYLGYEKFCEKYQIGEIIQQFINLVETDTCSITSSQSEYSSSTPSSRSSTFSDSNTISDTEFSEAETYSVTTRIARSYAFGSEQELLGLCSKESIEEFIST